MEQNLFGNKTILITGASGLVGSHLLLYLLQNSHAQIKAFVRNEQSKHKTESFLSKYLLQTYSIEWVFGNVEDYFSVLDACKSVDFVFHCAGYVSFDNSEAEKLYSVNVLGTENIVNSCVEQKVTKLCHVSSVAALGKARENFTVDEDCDFEVKKSRSKYGYSKFLGEMEVWRGIAEGLDAVIVNPSVILGVGQWNQSSGQLFKTVNKGMPFYTTGITGYISVHDVVKAMVLVTNSSISAERFILSAENISYKDLFSTIANSLNKPIPKYKLPKSVLNFAGICLTILARMQGKTSPITKQTAVTAYTRTEYYSHKFLSHFPISFKPISQEIEETALAFLQEKKL